jgi:hypothetical protein
MNRPSSPTPEPRHRQPGPARLGGTAPTGKRARPVEELEDQEDQTWPPTASGR